MENPNLFAHFRAQFKAHAAKIALETNGGRSYSYRDLDTESARLASCLRSQGLAPGDRVSVQVEKSPEALCLYLACLRAGLVYHPLNTGYTADELRYFFNDAEPALIVCDPDDAKTVEGLAGKAQVLTLDIMGRGSLVMESRLARTDFGVEQVEPDSLAALLYSSGTTGAPKGVMLTHANLLSNARALVETWGFSDADRLLHALPIFHVHGLFTALGCVLLSGASMIWLPKFSAAEAVRFLPQTTVLMGVPTYYTRLLADPDFCAEACSHMRLFISGSAPLLPETFAQFQARAGHPILERYGMTETGMNTSNPLDGERRPGTVGFPLPGVEVRAVDDNDRPTPAGEVGNLQVRGPNVFQGYWRLPDKTAEEFTPDGFFRTGDQGVIDADGYVSIVGRSKDMVISGGLNVYPKEVEQVIDRIAGVKESAVIGVPHPDLGEAVVAVVVPEPGAQLDEEKIIAETRRCLAPYKTPKRVVFIDALPRNTMAKVQKSRLRETISTVFGEPFVRIDRSPN